MSHISLSRITIAFSALFLLLTFGDAWSTHLALNAGFGQEFNTVMENGNGGMLNTRFWLINIIIGTICAGMLEWSIRNRQHVGEKYLCNPLFSVLNYLYINPFSKKNKPKALMHYPAMALSIIPMKAFAIANNVTIADGKSGFIDGLVMWLSQHLEGGALYFVAITVVILPFWTASLYLTAYLFKRDQTPKIIGLAA